MKGITLKPCPLCGSSLMIERDGGDDFNLVCLLGGHRFENKEVIRKLVEESKPVNISHGIGTITGIKKEKGMELTETQKGIYKEPEKPAAPPNGVAPKANADDYTPDEKKAIVEEGKAAGTKAGRRKVAEKYHINLYQLHAWDVNFNRPRSAEKKKLTPEKRVQLANARAARGKNKPVPAPQTPTPGRDPFAGIRPNPETASNVNGRSQERIYKCFGGDCPKFGNCLRQDVGFGKKELTPCPEYLDTVKERESAASKPNPEPSAPALEKKQLLDEGLKVKAAPEVHPIALRIELDRTKLDAELKEYHDKVSKLNDLKLLVLPPWRWYWVFFPSTVRQYFSALREIVNK